MKKITILALHLGVGGVENSIISLANMLCERYEVEIVSTYKLYSEPAFRIDDRVRVLYLLPEELKPNRKEFNESLRKFNIYGIIKEGFKALKVLYNKKVKMIAEIKHNTSDIVISTRIYHNRLLGKYGKNIKIKIAQEHNHHNNNKKYIRAVIKSLKNIDYLMPVSEELQLFYEKKIKEKNIKCVYIPHCIDVYPNLVSNLKEKKLISIGRLVKEKGYIDLIDIFEKFVQKMPDWNLNICGDGQEYDAISEKIQQLNLEGKVHLLGFKSKEELNDIFMESSIYVMTSYTESFGLVLIDAESYRIATSCF